MMLIGNHVFERFNNLRWEAQLGISTRGIVKVDKPDSWYYATINYSIIYKVLQLLALQRSDTFVDVGCGKGRVLCCAARQPCRKVVGVDYSEDLCKEARNNAQRLRGAKAPVLVQNGLAEDFDYTDATVLFLFNPFGALTLDGVLHKIDTDRGQRHVRLAFVNASADQDKVFAAHSWLERYCYWDVERGGGHSVSFYRRQGII
ncbi:class I SAM-dependent methyltransferase [Bradyrhizobium sp. STM 3562]|uniref:class I SAM-dependent methyltransferase n=1 Tax=Bradyrhizobium sp. STM 3562 TaxID=578924 RepID=UPI00388E02B6